MPPRPTKLPPAPPPPCAGSAPWPDAQSLGSAPAPVSGVAPLWLPTSTILLIMIVSTATKTSGLEPVARSVASTVMVVPASTQPWLVTTHPDAVVVSIGIGSCEMFSGWVGTSARQTWNGAVPKHASGSEPSSVPSPDDMYVAAE